MFGSFFKKEQKNEEVRISTAFDIKGIGIGAANALWPMIIVEYLQSALRAADGRGVPFSAVVASKRVFFEAAMEGGAPNIDLDRNKALQAAIFAEVEYILEGEGDRPALIEKAFRMIRARNEGHDTWKGLARRHIDAAVKTGQDVVGLVVQGPDAFFSASRTGGAPGFEDSGSDKIRAAIFAEVVQMVGATSEEGPTLIRAQIAARRNAERLTPAEILQYLGFDVPSAGIHFPDADRPLVLATIGAIRNIIKEGLSLDNIGKIQVGTICEAIQQNENDLCDTRTRRLQQTVVATARATLNFKPPMD